MGDRSSCDQAYRLTAEDVLSGLDVVSSTGLSAAEIERRRRLHGRNRLHRTQRKGVWIVLLDQFKSVIVWLLTAAVGLSFYFREWTQGVAILAVLAINSAIGFVTELRAIRSMDALRKLSALHTKVRRDGIVAEISAIDLVPGDIVILESGDIVTADIRLLESANIQCDESTLTGESVPVAKSVAPLSRTVALAERTNMVFKGTATTTGFGVGVVVATGMSTELGRISALAEQAQSEMSPLEKRLDRLGRQLVWATLVLTTLIALMGIYVGRDLLSTLEVAIALAVAAVPEGLPIIATMTLARGMWRMARRNALIERLSAVETLGATTVILTDKTGTLTENRMRVRLLRLIDGDVTVDAGAMHGRAVFSSAEQSLVPAAHQPLATALRVAALCNNAYLSNEEDNQQSAAAIGDPMEIALLSVARAAGMERPALADLFPVLHEEAFTTETKMMATYHRYNEGVLVAVKGAPEAVIESSTRTLSISGIHNLDDEGRRDWQRRNQALAEEGFRVLALATKEVYSEKEPPYKDLTLIGLVALIDPPRPDIADALAACRDAGVRVVMLTGDNAGTAKKIAADVGLVDDSDVKVISADELDDVDTLSKDQRGRILSTAIFARISPKSKLDLVALFQSSGDVVAMTGDGVNDAPALKKADIGIAMGQRGTQVAREAADMVLRDDAFASIVEAMRQGRVIFSNIRKFVVYLMSCNLSEILVIAVASSTGLPLPLLPLQILYLNLVTDVFPAFALGIGEGEVDVMRHPPRDPKSPIISRSQWLSIGLYSAVITTATLGAFVLAIYWLRSTESQAISIAFLTLALAQLLHVFNMRGRSGGLLSNEITTNPFIWGALALCAVLIASAVYLPGLSSTLSLVAPGLNGWLLVIVASMVPLLLGQTMKKVLIIRDNRLSGVTSRAL